MRYTEEKLVFGIGTALMMMTSWLLTKRYPELAVSLSTLNGGLMAVYAIFAGAHVSNKWVDSKTGKTYDEDIAADNRAQAQDLSDYK